MKSSKIDFLKLPAKLSKKSYRIPYPEEIVNEIKGVRRKRMAKKEKFINTWGE